MKHFMKRLAGFSLGPLVGAAISFILVPIFTNALSVEEFGRSSAFTNLITTIPTFIYIGMDQSYTREYHLRKDKRSIMQQAMLLPMIVGLIFVVIILIFKESVSTWLFKSEDYGYIIWYAAIWVLATIIERFLLLSIRMEEKAIEYSVFSILLKLGTFIVSMGMLFVGIRDFKAVIYGTLFGQLLADALLFYRYRHLLDFRGFKADPELIRQMFLFGLPIMVASSLAAALSIIDMVALTTFFEDVTNQAIYKAGSTIGSIIGIMKTAFASFWVPTAYRWYKENKSMKHYKFISDLLLFILSAMYFGIIALRYPLTLILSRSGEYNEVQYIMALLAFPHIMYTLSETTTLGIVFSRKTHYNIIVSVLALLVSAGVHLTLTPSLGFRGAALASTAAYMVFYLARTYYSYKTGFYFGQKKQLIVMCLMLIAGLVNLYPFAYADVVNGILAVLAISVQIPTLKTLMDIKNNPNQWDFS